jgi:hypothetical protein
MADLEARNRIREFVAAYHENQRNVVHPLEVTEDAPREEIRKSISKNRALEETTSYEIPLEEIFPDEF